MAEQLSSDHLDITITPVGDVDARVAGDAGGDELVSADDELVSADDEDALEDERRTVDITGHGAALVARMPEVEAAVSALAGIRVDGPTSADRPGEDSANEGDEP